MSGRLALRRHALRLSAVGFVLAACSTFGSEDPATPGDGDGGDGGDGGVEAASVDASDAAPDGDHVKVDAGCSWFCDSFDKDPWPGPGWILASTYEDGKIELTDAAFVSAPRSLRSSLSAEAGPTSVGRWPRVYLGNFTGLHCTVSVLLEVAGPDNADFLLVKANAPSGDWTVALNTAAAQTSLKEQGSFDQGIPTLPIGVWTRIGLDLKLGQATRVTFNGALESALVGPAADAGPTTFSGVTLSLGAERNNGVVGGEWRFDYDDVACSLDP